jgi:Pyruvate/2-oxoacid:ferredoxin oxidoreductase delta subunit/flavodoxin
MVLTALIVYFSQSGATARVAEAVAHGLRDCGYAIDLWNLKMGPPPDVRNYTLLGVGSPVYYYRVPFNVADLIASLPRLDGRPVCTFLVCGAHSFDAGTSLRRMLARTGAREVGYFAARGAGYFLGHLREGLLFSADHPTAAELVAAETFGRAVAARVAGKPYTPPPFDAKPPLIYRVERLLMSRWLIHHVYCRLFKVDHGKCTACGLCMDNCPTTNIARDERGHPLWGKECLGCFSCEKDCPEEAIASILSRPLLRRFVRPFFRYNVRTWRRDPALDYARVVHRRGKTELTQTTAAVRD